MIPPVFLDAVYIMGVLSLAVLGEENEKCEYSFSYKQSQSGKFASPKFPEEYPELIKCKYRFAAAPDGRIQLEFDYFDLEDMAKDDTSCRFDYIDVFNVDEMGYMSLVDRYCGANLPEPITSAQSTMEIVFVSDYTKTAKGFMGHYKFLDDNWYPFGPNTVSLNGYGGIIASPQFPGPYPGHIEKTWQIKVKEGQLVLVHLMAMDMGPTSQCSDPELLIYNGFATKDMLPVKILCGQLAAYDKGMSKYLSTASKIVIRFVSVNGNPLRSTGFKLSWSAVRIPGNVGNCDEFLCEGGKSCISTICPSMPRYCINKSLRCDRIPNCGPFDDSDERRCPREILIMTACIALPSLGIIGLVILVVYCYRAKHVTKSLSQEQPLANQRQVSRDSMSPSRSQCMMHTSFIDGKMGGEGEGGHMEKMDNGAGPPPEPSFKTHQKRASYHMMKQTFEDNNFVIAEI
ncbi:neuropilin and tolloid-like protein 2 [Haliotis asinina]|uniref:neuropilin and tolloid-like protein 2 n=1 Tax=Haliotis asinina TaxID=109174 RepID=UPI003531ABE1